MVILGRAVKGDFGYAITLGRLPVTRVIRSRLPATLHLGAMAGTIVLVVAFPLGVCAAFNRGRVTDTLARGLAFAGQSVPEFWLALLMVGMLNGIVLVETVFGWPGLGRLAVSAVTARDLFPGQGIVLLIGVMYLCANVVADIMYAIVDPRIKLGGNQL